MPVSVLRGLITSTEDPFAPHPRDHRSDHQNDDQRDADHDNGTHGQRLRRSAPAACRRFSYSDSPTRSPIAVRGCPLPCVASVRRFGENSIDRRTADAERGGDRADWFAAGVHPLCQSGFRFIQRPWPSNRLPACPTRIAGG